MEDYTFSDTITGEEFNNLRMAVGWRPITNKQAERGIEHTSFLVSVKSGEKIIGMGRILFDFGCVAYMTDIIVIPDYQGKGIGSRIVETLIQKLKNDSDVNDEILLTILSAKGKEGFYKKFGFVERPNETMGCGLSMWLKNEGGEEK